jgi:LPS sulfotransferase NodH/GT2 family glycosyltransferase
MNNGQRPHPGSGPAGDEARDADRGAGGAAPAPPDESGSGRPPRSYLVCALPQSGGRVLASSLRATGLVVPPDPRFWCGWRGHDLRTRQLLRRHPATAAAAGTYERVRAGGTGPSGAFGAAVRWPELDRLLDALRAAAEPVATGRPQGGAAPGGGRPPCAGATEHDLLRGFLPGLRYVHLTREDKAAQAVAWWRARHARDRTGRPGGAPAPAGPGGPENIDPAAIDRLERRLRADEWRWVSFFARAGVTPLVVSYEALTGDHGATVRRVLDFLEVPAAAGVAVPAPAGEGADGVDRARLDYVRWRRRRAVDGSFDAEAPVSVVITGHRPGDDPGAAAAAVRASVPADVEIVVVDDRSAPEGPGGAEGTEARPAGGGRGTDGRATAAVPGAVVVEPPTPTSPAAARNFGAGRAGGDILVFLDARACPRPGWLGPLREALAQPSVAVAGPAVVDGAGHAPAGFGLTWRDPLLRTRRLEQRPGAPVPVPFVPSCCMAFRRRDFEAVGGFDIGMVASGSEDAEICLHLWRRGRWCLVVPTSEVAHDRSTAAGPGDGSHPADAALYNALRLATMHFGPDTLLRTFDRATGSETFPEVYARLINSDVFERRRRVAAASTHDDAGFLDRFAIETFR